MRKYRLSKITSPTADLCFCIKGMPVETADSRIIIPLMDEEGSVVVLDVSSGEQDRFPSNAKVYLLDAELKVSRRSTK